ncbi:MAG: hypothetical protein QOH79_3879 [Acidimicrobiaceae bacterium]|jgi:hypothetical protein
MLWWAVPFVAMMALLPFAVLASSHTRDEPNTIAAVVGPTRLGAGPAPYEVVLGDGRTLFFDRDPGVHVDQVVAVRRRSSSNLLGLVVDGRYVASTKDQSTPAAPLFLLFGFFALLMGAAVLPAAIWGRRAYKQIRAELHAPTAETRGRYLGSWTWRGLTGRTWARSQSLGYLSGFPVAIEETPGQLSWYGAPIGMLSEVRHFETEIAGTSRQVVAIFHPVTRVLVRIATPDGTSSIDFERALDDLHPETGLSLKVSRRRRHAHLPDR